MIDHNVMDNKSLIDVKHLIEHRKNVYFNKQEDFYYNNNLKKRWKAKDRFKIKDEYTVDELLSYDDKDFIEIAYLAILNRRPDIVGFNMYSNSLRELKLSKIEILWELRNCDEGKKTNGAVVFKLRRKVYLYKIKNFFKYKIPFVRYIFKLLSILVTLPKHIKRLEILEVYIKAKNFEDDIIVNNNFNELFDQIQDSTIKLGKKINEQSFILKKLSETSIKYQEYVDNDIKREKELEDLKYNINKMSDNIINLNDNFSDLKHQFYEANSLKPNYIQIAPTRRDASISSINSMYYAFENKFRGSKKEIKERLKVYLQEIKNIDRNNSDNLILDIGCGRGEWIELLKDNDINAHGIDINPIMIKEALSEGLNVQEIDAFKYLKNQENNSFQVISGFHIVEHFSYNNLIILIDEVLRVLKPGGLVIFETPNPENILVGSCNFYLDPTHKNPLPPAFLTFLIEYRGFKNIKVNRIQPINNIDIDNEFIKDKFSVGQDYYVVGEK